MLSNKEEIQTLKRRIRGLQLTITLMLISLLVVSLILFQDISYRNNQTKINSNILEAITALNNHLEILNQHDSVLYEHDKDIYASLINIQDALLNLIEAYQSDDAYNVTIYGMCEADDLQEYPAEEIAKLLEV